jgi:hypothetical protein
VCVAALRCQGLVCWLFPLPAVRLFVLPSVVALSGPLPLHFSVTPRCLAGFPAVTCRFRALHVGRYRRASKPVVFGSSFMLQLPRSLRRNHSRVWARPASASVWRIRWAGISVPLCLAGVWLTAPCFNLQRRWGNVRSRALQQLPVSRCAWRGFSGSRVAGPLLPCEGRRVLAPLCLFREFKFSRANPTYVRAQVLVLIFVLLEEDRGRCGVEAVF